MKIKKCSVNFVEAGIKDALELELELELEL